MNVTAIARRRATPKRGLAAIEREKQESAEAERKAQRAKDEADQKAQQDKEAAEKLAERARQVLAEREKDAAQETERQTRDGQTWLEYRPKGVGYSIELPRQWTVSNQDVPTDLGPIKMYMATVNKTSAAYMSIYSIFPKDHVDRTPPETLLDNARNGAIRNVNGTLRTEQRMQVGGHPARHIVVDTDTSRVSQRLVLVDVKLIQAIYVGPAGSEKDADVVRFFGSFAVTGP